MVSLLFFASLLLLLLLLLFVLLCVTLLSRVVVIQSERVKVKVQVKLSNLGVKNLTSSPTLPLHSTLLQDGHSSHSNHITSLIPRFCQSWFLPILFPLSPIRPSQQPPTTTLRQNPRLGYNPPFKPLYHNLRSTSYSSHRRKRVGIPFGRCFGSGGKVDC